MQHINPFRTSKKYYYSLAVSVNFDYKVVETKVVQVELQILAQIYCVYYGSIKIIKDQI